MTAILKSAVTIMIPVLFSAAGGLLPALAGTLNIALEGLLLIGAFSSFAVYCFTGNIFISVAAAVFCSAAVSALYAFSAFKLKANIFICALAVNIFAGGITAVLSDKLFNTRGVVTSLYAGSFSGSSAALSDLAVWYLLIILFLLLLIWLTVNKTPFGYRLRACDKNSEALISLGINPQFYKISALLVSGAFCGIGGSFLSLNLGAFVPGMSAGKGWIALVVIFLGMRKPQGVLAAALVFGLAEAFSNHAQGIWQIPAGFVLAFPYVCTLIAMIAVSVLPISRKI